MGWVSTHSHFLGNSGMLSSNDCSGILSLKTLVSPNLHAARVRPGKSRKVVAFHGLRRPPYALDALEPYMSQKMVEMHWGEYQRAYVDGLNKQLEKNDILYGCTMDELVKVTYNNGNPLPEFNNAAQVWNHDFFWESMQPGGGDTPKLGLLQQIEKDFGSFLDFREHFIEAALTLFGSGWVWLVLKRQKKRLEVVKTSNAITPLVWDDIVYHLLSQFYLTFEGTFSCRSVSDWCTSFAANTRSRCLGSKFSPSLPPSIPAFPFAVGSFLTCSFFPLVLTQHAYYLDYKNDRARYVNAFMDHLVSWNVATGRMIRAEAFVNLGEPKIPVA